MVIIAAGMAVSTEGFVFVGARFLFAILSGGDFNPGRPNIRSDVVRTLAQSGIGVPLHYALKTSAVGI